MGIGKLFACFYSKQEPAFASADKAPAPASKQGCVKQPEAPDAQRVHLNVLATFERAANNEASALDVRSELGATSCGGVVPDGGSLSPSTSAPTACRGGACPHLRLSATDCGSESPDTRSQLSSLLATPSTCHPLSTTSSLRLRAAGSSGLLAASPSSGTPSTHSRPFPPRPESSRAAIPETSNSCPRPVQATSARLLTPHAADERVRRSSERRPSVDSPVWNATTTGAISPTSYDPNHHNHHLHNHHGYVNGHDDEACSSRFGSGIRAGHKHPTASGMQASEVSTITLTAWTPRPRRASACAGSDKLQAPWERRPGNPEQGSRQGPGHGQSTPQSHADSRDRHASGGDGRGADPSRRNGRRMSVEAVEFQRKAEELVAAYRSAAAGGAMLGGHPHCKPCGGPLATAAGPALAPPGFHAAGNAGRRSAAARGLVI